MTTGKITMINLSDRKPVKVICGFLCYLMVLLTVVPTIQATQQLRAMNLQNVQRQFAQGSRALSAKEMSGVVGGAGKDIATQSVPVKKVSAVAPAVDNSATHSPAVDQKANTDAMAAPQAAPNTYSLNGMYQSPKSPSGGNAQSGGGTAFRNALDGFNVDQFTGAATMSVPLAVPAGRGGIQPSLNLVYRSGGNNGWCGVGWDLDLGYIIRVGAKKGVPVYGSVPSTTDRFFFVVGGSSTELIYVGGAQKTTQNWKAYRAKIEGGCMRFSCFVNSSDIPLYWEATDKDGTTYTFGSTSASQTQGMKSSASWAYKWHLDRVKDVNDNSMTVSYENTGTPDYYVYPKQIDYTYDKNNQNCLYQVILNRSGRGDAITSYAAGFDDRVLKISDRLESVEIYADGVIQGKYLLQYTTSANSSRSLLTSITQYGKDNTSTLPATTFSYSQDNVYFDDGHTAASPYPSNPVIAPTSVAGDFDGNGMMDLWTYRMVVGPGPAGQYLWLASGDDAVYHNGTNWGDLSWLPGYTGSFMSNYCFGDFNGDGKTDIAFSRCECHHDPLMGDNFDSYLKVGYSNGATALTNIVDNHYQTFYRPGFLDSQTSDAITGDFNGDGKTDIYITNAFHNAFTSTAWMAIANTSGTGFSVTQQTSGPYTVEAWPIAGMSHIRNRAVGDFNGDGKADLAIFTRTDNKAHVYLSNGSSLSLAFEAIGVDTIGQIGDFNGDGLMDFATFKNYQVNVWYSTGHSFAGPVVTTFGKSVYPTQVAGDINNDGLTDIAAYVPNDGMYVWFGTGLGFNPAGRLAGHFGTSVYPQSPCGDINGDGLADLITFQDNYAYAWLSTGGKRDILDTIKNGYGGSVAIDYKPSTQYPNNLLPFAVPVVSSVTVNDGLSQLNPPDGGTHVYTTTYAYTGGLYNIPEKEFRGFATCTETKNDGTVDTTKFLQDATCQGKPYNTKLTKDNVLLSEQSNTWTVQTFASGNTGPVLTQTDGYIPYYYSGQNIQTRICYLYDGYGNVTKTTNYGYYKIDDQLFPGDDSYSISYYSYNPTKWIVNKPYETDFCSDADGVNIISGQRYRYDGDTPEGADWQFEPQYGRLKRLEHYYDQVGASARWTTVVDHFTYDDYGNLKTSKDPKGNVTTINYDPTNSLVSMRVNALNQTIVTNTYYGASETGGTYGQMKTQTDANNAVVNYKYDNFGRDSLVWGPGDQETSPTKSWVYALTADPSHQSTIIEYTKASDNQNYWTQTYVDGMGRTIQVHKGGDGFAPDNTLEIRVTKLYDSGGRNFKNTLPYYGTHVSPWWYVVPDANAKWMMTEYDGLGRVNIVTNPDNTTRTCSYDVNAQGAVTTQKDENDIRKLLTTDACGRLVMVQELNLDQSLYATTLYRYDLAGNLLWINPAKTGDADTSRFYYDSFGRKIMSYDPDRGTDGSQQIKWIYQYDLAGNLTKQIDARNQMVEFDYDALNRISHKKVNGVVTTTYAYDQGANGIGRLNSVTDPSGVVTFQYDIKGQLTSETRTLTGLTNGLTIGRQYTVAGQLQSITYPDLEQVTYTYDRFGRAKTASGALSYVTYGSYTAAGQPDTLTFGNGMITDYDYNQNRLWLSDMSVGPLGDPGKLQKLHYEYDGVGNVTTKNIITTGIAVGGRMHYEFQYDDQYRLIKDTCASYATTGAFKYVKRYSYDVVGNRTAPNNPGYQYYANTNRLSTDGSRSFTYDANGNVIGCGGNTYTFDPENRFTRYVSGTTSIDYTYNSIGLQVKKVWTYQIEDDPGGQYAMGSLPVQNGGEETKARAFIRKGVLNIDVEKGAFSAEQPLYLALDIDQTAGSGTLIIPDAGRTPLEAASAWEYCLVVKGTEDFGYYDQALRQYGQGEAAAAGMKVQTVKGRTRISVPLSMLGSPKRVSVAAVAGIKNIKQNVTKGENTDLVMAKSVGVVTTTTETDYTYYLYNESGQVLCELDQNGAVATKMYYFNGQKIGERQTGTMYYCHNDHLGSMMTMTTTTGGMACRKYYKAFGEDFLGTELSKYTFNGKLHEVETGLFYYGARYYDASLGRFISCDPLIGNLANPQSLNPYAYCANNPQTHIDPNGKSFLSIFSTIFSIATTFAGIPWLGALVGAGLTYLETGNGVQTIGGLALGFVTGGIGGFTAGAICGSSASLGVAMFRGGLAGAISGALGAWVSGGSGDDIRNGAIAGALGGMAVGAAKWDYNRRTTNAFMKTCNWDNVSDRAKMEQAIKEIGQVPGGNRVFRAIMEKGISVELNDGYLGLGGQHYLMMDGSHIAAVNPSSDWNEVSRRAGCPINFTSAVFHEIAHTLTMDDAYNCENAENMFNPWNGLPSRSYYDAPSKTGPIIKDYYYTY